MKAVKRVWLKKTPLDKWTGERWVQATGYDVKLEDGRWVTEFEGDEYEDTENCIYEDEADSKEWNDYFRQKDKVYIVVDNDTGEVYKEVETDYRGVVEWSEFKGFVIVDFEQRNRQEIYVLVKRV